MLSSMFKKAYAVVVDSYIDGGAPGYYADK